jgi:hypothetical protein
VTTWSASAHDRVAVTLRRLSSQKWPCHLLLEYLEILVLICTMGARKYGNSMLFFMPMGTSEQRHLDTNRPDSVCKIGMVGHLLESHLNTKNRPSSIGYIELRYLRSDVAVCVAHATAKTPMPPIPFEGFIQSSKNSLK